MAKNKNVSTMCKSIYNKMENPYNGPPASMVRMKLGLGDKGWTGWAGWARWAEWAG